MHNGQQPEKTVIKLRSIFKDHPNKETISASIIAKKVQDRLGTGLFQLVRSNSDGTRTTLFDFDMVEQTDSVSYERNEWICCALDKKSQIHSTLQEVLTPSDRSYMLARLKAQSLNKPFIVNAPYGEMITIQKSDILQPTHESSTLVPAFIIAGQVQKLLGPDNFQLFNHSTIPQSNDGTPPLEASDMVANTDPVFCLIDNKADGKPCCALPHEFKAENSKIDLSGLKLSGCTFYGKSNFVSYSFTHDCLSGAEFYNTQFINCDFTNADLAEAKFQGCHFHVGCTFGSDDSRDQIAEHNVVDTEDSDAESYFSETKTTTPDWMCGLSLSDTEAQVHHKSGGLKLWGTPGDKGTLPAIPYYHPGPDPQ